MDYDAARLLISDGDLVAVRRSHGFLTPLTEFFTRSQYTHVGIVLSINGSLWMVELNGGSNHLIPLSQLRASEFDVFAPPVDAPSAVRKAILGSLEERIDYGFAAMVVIGLLDWLRVSVFIHARRALVCSGYAVMIYEQSGWAEHTRILSPRGLTELLKLKLEVRPVAGVVS